MTDEPIPETIDKIDLETLRSASPEDPVMVTIPDFFVIEDVSVMGGVIFNSEINQPVPQVFAAIKFLDHDNKHQEATFAFPVWNALQFSTAMGTVAIVTADGFSESMPQSDPSTSTSRKDPTPYM